MKSIFFLLRMGSIGSSMSARVRQLTPTQGLEGTKWKLGVLEMTVMRSSTRAFSRISNAIGIPPMPAPKITMWAISVLLIVAVEPLTSVLYVNRASSQPQSGHRSSKPFRADGSQHGLHGFSITDIRTAKQHQRVARKIWPGLLASSAQPALSHLSGHAASNERTRFPCCETPKSLCRRRLML